MQLPTSFHKITAIMEVPLSIWSDALAVSKDLVVANDETLTHEGLFDFLTQNNPSELLLDAMCTLDDLGTDNGRESLLEAAEDQGLDLGSNDDQPTRELVLNLWVQSRSKSELQRVIARARIAAQITAKNRQCHEFVGLRPTPLPQFDKNEFLQSIKTWCDDNGHRPPVEIFSYRRGSEWRCELLNGEALKRVIQIKEGSASQLLYRPAVSDHLRYDAETGRLSVASKSLRRRALYRAMFGQILADNRDFFKDENVCTLRPLRDRGKALFDIDLPHTIHKVSVTELLWRPSDQEKVRVTGRDCFRALDKMGANLHEGELIEAKLSVTFSSIGRRGIVTLKVPNRIEINAGTNQQYIEQMLDDVGIRGNFSGLSMPMNIWTCFPWRMSEMDWRQFIGSKFDESLSSELLKPVVLNSVSHPDHPSDLNALTVTQSEGDTFLGVSETRDAPSRILSMTDVQGYQLQDQGLAEKLNSVLKLQGQSQQLGGGLWRLGNLEFPPTVNLCLFLAMRQPCKTEELQILNCSNGSQPVLLLPQGCHYNTNLCTVSTRLPFGSNDDLLRKIVLALNLQRQIDVRLWAEEDLVMDLTGGRSWYRGVELTKLQPDTHPFKFAALIAAGRGTIITNQAIINELSPADISGQVPKKAKSGFMRAVTKSYQAAEVICPPGVSELFVAKAKKGYALKGSAYLFE